MDSTALSGLCRLLRQRREEQDVARGAEVLARMKEVTPEALQGEVREEIERVETEAPQNKGYLEEFGPKDAVDILQHQVALSKLSLLGSKGAQIKERQALEERPAEKQWQAVADGIKSEGEKFDREAANSAFSSGLLGLGFRYHSKDNAVKQTGTCFLCGHPLIDKDDWNDKSIKSGHGLSLQCEHLIPSAATYLFFGDGKSFGLQEILQLNYRWAHAACNNKKSNQLFINMIIAIRDEMNKVFAFGFNPRQIFLNESLVKNFLSELWHATGPQRQQLKQSFDMMGTDTWEKFYPIAFASITENFAPLIMQCNGPGKQKFERTFFFQIVNVLNKYDPAVRERGETLTGVRMPRRGGKHKRNYTRRNKKFTKLVS